MRIGTFAGTFLLVGAIVSTVPSPAQCFCGPYKMRQPYMADDDLQGSGQEVARASRRSHPAKSKRAVIALSKARLSYNKWLRSHHRGSVVDLYCTQVMTAKLYVDTHEGRRVTMQSLANEVAPEIVALPTALRYIRELEQRGFILITKEGRDKVVTATDKFFTHYNDRLRRLARALEDVGYKSPTDQADGELSLSDSILTK